MNRLFCNFNTFTMDHPIYMVKNNGLKFLTSVKTDDIASTLVNFAHTNEINKVEVKGVGCEFLVDKIKEEEIKKYSESTLEIEVK